VRIAHTLLLVPNPQSPIPNPQPVGLLTGWFSIRSSAIRHMSSIKRPTRRKEHKERNDA